MSSYADWVSTGALTLSGALAVREFRDARSDHPRITLRPLFNYSAAGVTVSLHVTNSGRTPVTVSAVGWEFPLSGSTSKPGSTQVSFGHSSLDPPMPHRLEGHDDVTWEWPDEVVDELIQFGSFRGYADIFGYERRPTRRWLRRGDANRHRYYAGDWSTAETLVRMKAMLDEPQRD